MFYSLGLGQEMSDTVGQGMGGFQATAPEAKYSNGSASQKEANPRRDTFTTDERNAMRSFLQRCEVRLSTMHRVAVGFISGAGLLLLLPVFLKDGVLTLITALLNYTPTLPTTLQSLDTIGVVALYLCLIYPFLLSLSLPAVALYLLLEDTVRFYFVGHPPTFSEEFFNPRFSLTGVAFSPDESEEVKARVLRHEYGTDLINFVISHADAHSRYYSNIIDKPRRLIVPSTRKLPRLLKAGVLEIAWDKPLEELKDEDRVRVQGTYNNSDGDELLLNKPYMERTVDEIDRFNAALGLAGFIERPLYQEVAKTEVSLVRHGLKLRRLVLRYFQAFLILVWTSLITFLMLPFLHDTTGRFPVPLVFAVAYLIWALLAPRIVQLPIIWLVSHPHDEMRRKAVRSFQKLDALQTFGKHAQLLCYGAVLTSLVALALGIMLKM
jgi:hypothetical protein